MSEIVTNETAVGERGDSSQFLSPSAFNDLTLFVTSSVNDVLL